MHEFPRRISISSSYFSRPPFHASSPFTRDFQHHCLSYSKNNPAKEGKSARKRRGEKRASVSDFYFSLSLFLLKCTVHASNPFQSRLRSSSCSPPRPQFAIIARLKRFEGEIVKLHDNGGGV